MSALSRMHHRMIAPLARLGDNLIIPTLARFLFAAVLFMYYWKSAVTKLGGGGVEALFSPTFNAFAQIFPKGAEAASYDITQATLFQKAVTLAGTWGEFILPVLIIIGLLTRVAAIGMIVFVVLQSLTDLFGHGGLADAAVLGAWFDGLPNGVILDQRALWVFLLAVIAVRGAGPLSLDRLIFGRMDGGAHMDDDYAV